MENTTPASAHTSGPWNYKKIPPEFSDRNEGFRVDGDGEFCYVASVFFSNRYEEGEANARLIAAAPELLAACKRAFHVFENDTTLKQEVMAMIEAAVAKAGGR